MDSKPTNRYFKSKNISLFILAVTAAICARVPFLLLNDPEGPNLLIIGVFTASVFIVSGAIYLLAPVKSKGIERLAIIIAVQILLVAGLYFLMK